MLENLNSSRAIDSEEDVLPFVAPGTTGIVTFELTQKGILVDNKAFTGQHITINGRATFVLIKKNTWKILHYHLDKISN